MKVIIEMDLTDAQVTRLRTNSLERVFNTAIRLNETFSLAQKDEDGWINKEELKELKPLASRLWNAAQNATYLGERDG